MTAQHQRHPTQAVVRAYLTPRQGTRANRAAMIVAAAAWGSLISAGCELPASHKACIEHREQQIKSTADWFARGERRRPEKLDATIAMAGKDYQRRVERCRETPGQIDPYIQDSFDRFRESQSLYRKEAMDRLNGHPEKIERILPEVIY